MANKIIAIVPAAGTGTRLGDTLPKQYIDINGKPMIHYALAALAAVERISSIHVVLSPNDQHWLSFDWTAFNNKLTVWHCGGESRASTVLQGLQAIRANTADDDWVLVHDAARPCLRVSLTEQFLDEIETDSVGGLLALPMADTIKMCDQNSRVSATLPRENLWRAQTPQMFRYAMLLSALTKNPRATDEAQAIEALGHQPKCVLGDSANLKVTYAPDIKIARILLSED